MAFPTSVDTLIDGTTVLRASQVLGPQRVSVGPAWFNVKSDQFGALGDGTTDDTAAINAAEVAASAAGGTVYFPPGAYVAQGVVKLSNSNWLGAGATATAIKLQNSASTSVPRVIVQNFATLTGGNTTGGISGFKVEKLSFDGNKTNNGSYAVPLIQWYAYGYEMASFIISQAQNACLYSEWSTSGPITYPGLEAKIRNFTLMFGRQDGIQWNGPHDSLIGPGIVSGMARHSVWVQASGGGPGRV